MDPDTEPRHAPLAVAWLQRALRAALPFSFGVATRDPGPLARAVSAVDPAAIGRTSLEQGGREALHPPLELHEPIAGQRPHPCRLARRPGRARSFNVHGVRPLA